MTTTIRFGTKLSNEGSVNEFVYQIYRTRNLASEERKRERHGYAQKAIKKA